MPAATASRKRKQTDDMETSPPKRVTRARSAKTQDAAPAPKPARATKAASTAKAVEKPKVAAAASKKAAPVKRATRSKDSEEPTQAEQTELGEPEAPKTRGRPKKTVTMSNEPANKTEVPKTRGKPAKATVTATKSQQSTTTRTRTRVQVAEESEDELMGTDTVAPESEPKEEKIASPEVKKTTRGRPAAASKSTTKNIKITAPSTRAAASSRATGATAATTARTAAGRKKVAFAEDAQDKENVPIRGRASAKTKADEKPTSAGVRAKPARKAATASTVTTTSKTRSAATKKDAVPKAAPLSPKKVSQVAKGTSSESEDELGSNSPGRMINKSPVRPPPSARKELPFANSSVQSPTKGATQDSAEPLLAQSPMKPPQSVRKGMPLGSESVQTVTKLGFTTQADSSSRQPTLTASLLLSPAKRLPASSSRAAASGDSASPSKPSSHLLASPARRVHMDMPKLNKEDSQPENSLKQSLLQSPARRPRAPVSGSMTSIPKEKKPQHTFGDVSVSSRDVQTFNFSAATPRKVVPRRNVQTANEDQSVDLDNAEVDDESLAGKAASPSGKADEPLSSDAGIAELDFDDTVIMSPTHDEHNDEQLKDVVEQSPGSKEPVGSTTPPGLPSPSIVASMRPSTLRTGRILFRDNINEDSEDDLSASGSFRMSNNSLATPTPGLRLEVDGLRAETTTDIGLTPLAHKLSAWDAKSVTSQGHVAATSLSSASEPAQVEPSPAKRSYFDDEMLSRSSDDFAGRQNGQKDVEMDVSADTEAQMNSLETSEDASEYGDENTLPIDPQLMDFAVPMELDFTIPMDVDVVAGTADPLELHMTPAQAVRPLPREVMTVSKVPLKPADHGSPTKTFRKKAKSLAPMSLDEESSAAADTSFGELSLSPGPQASELTTPTRNYTSRFSIFNTPGADDTLLKAATPFRTPRVGADAQILRGAVIYVDVHTTEGADANGIFVELLSQMGARCVKQWSWNPRSSSTGNNGETPGGSKVGITHVVFKDGGKRTLSKVREAKGLVSCVGVGWVLDCERENKWLDEADYAVDTSSVPRGGHNRRKSMEPKALSNINGTLKPALGTPGRSVSTPTFGMSPTKEFLTFSTENSPVDASGPSFNAATPTINFGAAQLPVPETPAVLKDQDWAAGEDFSKTPTTPYFMTKGAELVQATCPPKQQTGRMLFPVSGRIEDEPDADVRRRLVLARRKSLQWAPKIGSPLRRE